MKRVGSNFSIDKKTQRVIKSIKEEIVYWQKAIENIDFIIRERKSYLKHLSGGLRC